MLSCRQLIELKLADSNISDYSVKAVPVSVFPVAYMPAFHTLTVYLLPQNCFLFKSTDIVFVI